MMQVTVRFFASLRESTGTGRCDLNVPSGATIDELIAILVDQYPALSAHRGSWHFAVNQNHAESDRALQDGDRVAIFPYIAGG